MATNPKYSCCTFRGSIVALDASNGKTLWKSYTIAEEPKPGAMSSAGVQLMAPPVRRCGQRRPSMPLRACCM
jgi:polyvinyl alcohol dehydrogenase (cytochrome)